MTDVTWETVRTEQRGWLGILTLHRPGRMNALTPTLLQELGAASRALVEQGVKVIVITGDEQAFCAGADLSVVADMDRIEDFHTFNSDLQQAFGALEALGVITVAAIDGFCLGGGLELALRCDFRLASSRAKLGLPEIRHGLLPTGGGLTTLVALVGLRQAKSLVLSGRMLDAPQALAAGLVDEIVDAPAVDAAATWAETFRDHPRLAVRAAKKAFRLTRTGTPAGWSEAVEVLTACMLVASDEGKEGMNAFLESRQAQFP